MDIFGYPISAYRPHTSPYYYSPWSDESRYRSHPFSPFDSRSSFASPRYPSFEPTFDTFPFGYTGLYRNSAPSAAHRQPKNKKKGLSRQRHETRGEQNDTNRTVNSDIEHSPSRSPSPNKNDIAHNEVHKVHNGERFPMDATNDHRQTDVESRINISQDSDSIDFDDASASNKKNHTLQDNNDTMDTKDDTSIDSASEEKTSVTAANDTLLKSEHDMETEDDVPGEMVCKGLSDGIVEQRLAKLQKIHDEVEAFRVKHLDNFVGRCGSKKYLYASETLISYLLKLDEIQAEGNDAIRAKRKAVVVLVEDYLKQLDDKALRMDNNENSS